MKRIASNDIDGGVPGWLEEEWRRMVADNMDAAASMPTSPLLIEAARLYGRARGAGLSASGATPGRLGRLLPRR